MTSIGLGEDGPTHQPVEHMAALRALPNLLVFRPADAVETAECSGWRSMAQSAAVGSCLVAPGAAASAFGRAGEHVRRGAYVLRDAEGVRDVTILATGSEVETAVVAAEKLAAEGVKAAVVSMPCWELFERQDAAYREAVLG